jgi:hypothetical protein
MHGRVIQSGTSENVLDLGMLQSQHDVFSTLNSTTAMLSSQFIFKGLREHKP